LIFETGGLVRLGKEDHERFLQEFSAEYPENLEFNVYGELRVEQEDSPLSSEKLEITLLPGKGEVGIHTVMKRSGQNVQSVAADIERIERFFDAMALACQGRSILVEPRLRSARVAISAPVDQGLLDGATDVLLAVEGLPIPQRPKVERALAWYRDSFRTRSPVNHFSMLWNALEILVSERDGPSPGGDDRLRAARTFLNERGDRLTLKDLNEVCFGILQESIPSRMKRGFQRILGNEAAEFIEKCFERRPLEARLWEVRNDINHGNIVERNSIQVARVIDAAIDLHPIVWKTVSRTLGVDPRVRNQGRQD
jgi:hypothetical protein